jgi:hypothetical protein
MALVELLVVHIMDLMPPAGLLEIAPFFVTCRCIHALARSMMHALAIHMGYMWDEEVTAWLRWVDPRASMPAGMGWWSYSELRQQRGGLGCPRCGLSGDLTAHGRMCDRFELILRIIDRLEQANTLHQKMQAARFVLRLDAFHVSRRMMDGRELAREIGMLQMGLRFVMYW